MLHIHKNFGAYVIESAVRSRRCSGQPPGTRAEQAAILPTEPRLRVTLLTLVPRRPRFFLDFARLRPSPLLAIVL